MEKLKIKVKKLHKDAVIPQYAKIGDAGLDLTATNIVVNNKYVAYKTGLAFEIPEGYVGLLFPRSSNCNKSLILSNSVGVLDSGYRGEVEFRYKYTSVNETAEEFDVYDIGDKVGQLVIIPYPQVELIESDDISQTERGEKGFGSTGS